ncbi:S4 domain-containing protein YaaA [Salicibibacter halophilus]|uniref:S4 domain-containing protein YaaA n=1 Tax=Salicibibacter halophilus TaxID=2502791 RepID=A0A514LIF7_9BACI|nr:S4 domain-containing protein YaaA [Salicibibacter halophilus]QDI91636.1 S4 domain-containing protein YaaA [Salicibibacter halophilus]
MEEKIRIETPYIALGQLLKEVGVADTGGMVKIILAEYNVYVNDEHEVRRGRKLYPGDRVEVEDTGTFIVEEA